LLKVALNTKNQSIIWNMFLRYYVWQRLFEWVIIV
jgi:hypothetical protein